MKTFQMQATYSKCKDCEFLEYWGFCTESIDGEPCSNVNRTYNDIEESKE